MTASRNTWTHRAIGLSVMLCVAGCTTVPTSKPPLSIKAQAEALSHFSLGLLAENAKNPEAALRHLEASIKIDPDEQTLYPPAIAVALQLGHKDEARKLARQLRKKQPDSLPPRLLQAQVCVLSDQPEEAEQLFREAATDFPNDPAGTLTLARFLVSLKRTPEAIAVLESARKQHADQPDLLHLLGTLYVSQAHTTKLQSDASGTVLKGIDLLKKSLTGSPGTPQQWQQLGYAYLAVKKAKKATAAFETAYTLAPEDILIAQQLLELCIRTESFERALELCDKIPTQTHTEPELWIQYLSENLPKDHDDLLIDYLQNYLKEHPQSPVFYYVQLESLYLDQKRLPEAKTLLREAQALYPADGRLRTMNGYLYLQQKHYEEAYQTFHQVKIDTPDANWTTHSFFELNFIVTAQKTDRLKEAAEELTASYTNNPTILNQYMHELFSGRTPLSNKSAIDLLQVFHQLVPESIEALYYLSLLQTEQQDYEHALNNARQFEIRANQKNPALLDESFYYQYAALQERTGNLDQAEILFRKAIDFGEKSTTAAAQNYIAYMWAERGEKLDKGLALIQNALTAEPDNASFLDTLGWIYYMQGNYQKALRSLKRASKLIQTENPEVWTHLGETYLKLGNPRAAVEQWKKALKLTPDNESLIERIKTYQLSPDGFPAPADSPANTPSHP